MLIKKIYFVYKMKYTLFLKDFPVATVTKPSRYTAVESWHSPGLNMFIPNQNYVLRNLILIRVFTE